MTYSGVFGLPGAFRDNTVRMGVPGELLGSKACSSPIIASVASLVSEELRTRGTNDAFFLWTAPGSILHSQSGCSLRWKRLSRICFAILYGLRMPFVTRVCRPTAWVLPGIIVQDGPRGNNRLREYSCRGAPTCETRCDSCFFPFWHASNVSLLTFWSWSSYIYSWWHILPNF